MGGTLLLIIISDYANLKQFTEAIVTILNLKKQGLVFMLWGNHAIKRGASIDKKKHLVLTAAHPSPLSASRGFFGCKHFSKANEYLTSLNKDLINWSIVSEEAISN